MQSILKHGFLWIRCSVASRLLLTKTNLESKPQVRSLVVILLILKETQQNQLYILTTLQRRFSQNENGITYAIVWCICAMIATRNFSYLSALKLYQHHLTVYALLQLKCLFTAVIEKPFKVNCSWGFISMTLLELKQKQLHTRRVYSTHSILTMNASLILAHSHYSLMLSVCYSAYWQSI